jgi:hypothetical protein
MRDHGVDIDSLEACFHRFKSLYKLCRKGRAAEEYQPGLTNIDALWDWAAQLYEWLNFRSEGHDCRLLRRYWKHEKEFFIQLCHSLAEQVRERKRQIGFMSDPKGPYRRVIQNTKDHDLYDWSIFGVSNAEKQSWSSADYMDADFLAAEREQEDVHEEEASGLDAESAMIGYHSQY